MTTNPSPLSLDKRLGLRELGGSTLFDLFCTLLESLFGEAGETGIALRWDIRIKHASLW